MQNKNDLQVSLTKSKAPSNRWNLALVDAEGVHHFKRTKVPYSTSLSLKKLYVKAVLRLLAEPNVNSEFLDEMDSYCHRLYENRLAAAIEQYRKRHKGKAMPAKAYSKMENQIFCECFRDMIGF